MDEETTPQPGDEQTPVPSSESSGDIAAEAPTEPAPIAPPATTPPAEPPPETPPAGAAAEPPGGGEKRWSVTKALVIAAIVLVLGLGGGFLIGRATDDSGPDSLAAAVRDTAHGDLPLGDGSLNDLLRELGGSGALRQLIEGLGRNGTNLPNLPGIPNQPNQTTPTNPTNPTTPQNPASGQAFLGVAVETADGTNGVRVASVSSGSPAAQAGIQAGDVITAIDGAPVRSSAELGARIHAYSVGDQVKVTYVRNGTTTDVQVKLGTRTSTTTPTSPPS